MQTVLGAVLIELDKTVNPMRGTHGINAKAQRLAAQFLSVHFPHLAAGATADRLRRRPSTRLK
jgi:hypothetical protein